MRAPTLTEIAFVLASSFCVNADTTTTINPRSNWGTWEGWGTSLAWWAQQFGDRDDLADIFFTLGQTRFGGQTLPGLGFNHARYNAGACSWNSVDGESMVVSPNVKRSRQMEGFWLDWKSEDSNSASWDWSVDVNQRTALNKAIQRGVSKTELFSNSPMWWMTKNHNPSGAADGSENIQSWNLEKHAIYMATVAEVFKSKYSIEFETVDPFNEPTANWWKADGTQEGCHIDISTQARIIEYLDTQLKNRGLSTVIAASDESYYDQAETNLRNIGSSALSKIKRVNVHGYQYGSGDRVAVHELSTAAGKPVYNSEYGDGKASGEDMARNLLYDFRYLKPVAWEYWQVLDQGGWGLIDADNDAKTLGSATQKYFVMAQFARHIRPGMQILDGGADNVVAAYDASRSKLVIVAVNWDDAQYLNFELSGFSGRPSSGATVTRWATQIGSGEQFEACSFHGLSVQYEDQMTSHVSGIGYQNSALRQNPQYQRARHWKEGTKSVGIPTNAVVNTCANLQGCARTNFSPHGRCSPTRVESSRFGYDEAEPAENHASPARDARENGLTRKDMGVGGGSRWVWRRSFSTANVIVPVRKTPSHYFSLSKVVRRSTFHRTANMSATIENPQTYLAKARIAPEIFQLRPDYRALLMVVTGIPPKPSDAASEAYLASAEASAKAALAKTPVNDIPHVVQWKEAYKAFGAKPKKTMNSLEALLRRTDVGLPRVNRLTDIYNAVSISHQIPLGGEDLDKYQGSPYLARAKGDEKFDTKSGGEIVIEHPSPGEAVWCDNEGVTCRRWNWRQCSRTALSDSTTNVLFILDALEALDDERLNKAADELSEELRKLSADVKVILTLDAYRIKNHIQIFLQCLANICLSVSTVLQYGEVRHSQARALVGHDMYNTPFAKNDWHFWQRVSPGLTVCAVMTCVYLVLLKYTPYFVFAFIIIYSLINVHYVQPEFSLTLAIIPATLLHLAFALIHGASIAYLVTRLLVLYGKSKLSRTLMKDEMVFYISIAIGFSISTLVVGFICFLNFNKGLKPILLGQVQRKPRPNELEDDYYIQRLNYNVLPLVDRDSQRFALD
ncbi:glycoside hydrolase family 30 protein [Stemphylium lycopersici]|uniref:Glycoside hydrolase family 30 protein n=1 Tax=Stemphylium lycopersici TaxID=183478 RepID=A0A364MUJ6_STELY|nr:glycoside hydrolase family 30 protein [Stemphylium lycopersici]RAR03220.1 glycoside hydrolase family 30 protein [Stemphylium lycopersici]